MKRNLKIFLLIAVCAITGICMLCVREENKKLKEEQKQLYEINGYLTNERNALVEYRNDIENSKTRRMLQKIDKVRGK